MKQRQEYSGDGQTGQTCAIEKSEAPGPVGLVGLWDCVASDEVAGIRFKDKDGVQIMKDYMASGSFARGKEEKAASASMVYEKSTRKIYCQNQAKVG